MNDPVALVRFGLLGPLRVWRGETAVDLGPLQQRVVLAVLALQAGRPVGRQHLIDAVWGETTPRNAVNLVQRHVSGLRRVLEPGRLEHTRSGMLAWTDAGYLLTLPAGALDLDIYERELGHARAARTAGHIEEAAEALRAALGLWRGPVCDGLHSPYLDAQRDRLAESRIDVIEERIELELAIGDHADLVPELRDLVAEHPLRERLRGLLMLVLYRADRQADALAVFRAARRHLHEELGVEPGAPLQRLHQQILAADPKLSGTAAAGVAAGASPGTGLQRPLPAQLPHRIPDFTGRDAELSRLDALVARDGGDAGTSVVITAIAGTAGVGKTTLAVHWAHQIRDRFPDGQLYVNLRGFDPAGPAMEPAEAIRAFLDALGVPPDRIPLDIEAQAALYRTLLANRRVLIVLDNARDSSHVRQLLPGTPLSLVIVTSRNQLLSLVATDGAQLVAIDLLSSGEARHLLARRLGKQRIAAEPTAVDQIIASCAGLPLALSIVSARAAANMRLPLADLAEELRETHGGLYALDGGDTQTNIRAVFSWSYNALRPPAARLFRLLGLHAGPDIGLAGAASLIGFPAWQARALLTELTSAHLLTSRDNRRFTFHDLLRAYARELVETHDPAEERRAAVQRVLDHYLHTAYRADQLLRPSQYDVIALGSPSPLVITENLRDHHEALKWFTAEYPVLLAALRLAANDGFDVHTWQLAWALTSFFDRSGRWHEAAHFQRAALEAANRLGDPYAQAKSHGCLAYTSTRLRRYDDAHGHLLHALGFYRALGDQPGQAHAHRSLAWVFDQQGSYQEALSHAQQAFELFRAARHVTGQARSLSAVGWFHIQLGDPEIGLMHCRQALDLQKEIGDQLSQAETLSSIASGYQHLGHHQEAVAHYQQALELFREFGARHGEAVTLAYLGDAHLAGGDPAAALEAWHLALAILSELGHPEASQVRGKLDNLAGKASLPNYRGAAGDDQPRSPLLPSRFAT
jgi:DNA-binding SARP family transcriptional activator/tetratricopeptide (TPR) repeat protein/CheY-like chemotaxis protein